MNPHLEAAALAVARAWRLSADLSRSRRPSDIEQVSSGVRHELSSALNALASATGMNPQGMHDSVLEDLPEVQNRVLEHLVRERMDSDTRIQAALELEPLLERLARGALADAGLIMPVGSGFDEAGAEHTLWAATELGRRVVLRDENPQVEAKIGDQLPLL